MTKYSVRFVHKISPRDTDVEGPYPFKSDAFTDRKTLGAALRHVGALNAGERVREFRKEGEKIIAFPVGSIWHSIILTPTSTTEYPELTTEQLGALRTFAAENGKDWKEALSTKWIRAAAPGYLQQVRNSHGPEWLFDVCPANP
jgi:hypothetical protein